MLQKKRGLSVHPGKGRKLTLNQELPFSNLQTVLEREQHGRDQTAHLPGVLAQQSFLILFPLCLAVSQSNHLIAGIHPSCPAQWQYLGPCLGFGSHDHLPLNEKACLVSLPSPPGKAYGSQNFYGPVKDAYFPVACGAEM